MRRIPRLPAGAGQPPFLPPGLARGDAALRLRPEHGCRLLGDILLDLRRVAESQDAYRAALPRHPDPVALQARLWTCAMLLGDFEEAWRLGDALLACRREDGSAAGRPRHFQNLWRGQPVAGRVLLLRCFHGLGDTIQFIRFAEPLRRLAARLVVRAQPELLPLLRPLAPIDLLLPLDGPDDPPFEVEIESMEAAHLLRHPAAALPGRVPYLRADHAQLQVRRRQLACHPGFTIGLVWSAGNWDGERSVPLALFGWLAAIPGLAVVNLQRGAAQEEAKAVPLPWLELPEVDPQCLPATAATVACLDLLITVDTMAAHLAGALGVSVWVLLKHAADWRWQHGREDSPWYPTMRLFRQTAPGDWRAPLRAVAAELPAFLARRMG
jgi:hypothetical protein